MATATPCVIEWMGFSFQRSAVPEAFPANGWLGLHSLELETYQTYVGATAQHTAVHVQRAAAALAQLADSAEMRRNPWVLRDSGVLRRCSPGPRWPVFIAACLRSWPIGVVLLITDQAAAGARLHPSRGEPFADFQHFATQVLKPDLVLRLPVGVTAADLHDRLTVQLNTLYAGLRGTTDEAMELLQRLEAAGEPGLTVADLCSGWPKQRQPFLETTLVWLAKMGLVDWLPSA